MSFFYTGSCTTTRQIVATKASAALGRVVSVSSVVLLAVEGSEWRFGVKP